MRAVFRERQDSGEAEAGQFGVHKEILRLRAYHDGRVDVGHNRVAWGHLWLNDELDALVPNEILIGVAGEIGLRLSSGRTLQSGILHGAAIVEADGRTGEDGLDHGQLRLTAQEADHD